MGKQKYFEERELRVNQKLKILLERKDFQTDIAVFRKKWNISKGGFKTEDGYREWMGWLETQTDKYIDENWSKCRAELQELSKQGKLSEREELNRKFNHQSPRNAFHYEIHNLLFKHKIPTSWYSGMRLYLLSNDLGSARVPLNNVTVQITWNEQTGERQLSLLLTADSTMDDVKAVWKPLVMPELRKLHDYSVVKGRYKPNLELDKRVHELWKAGDNTYEQIAEVIKSEFPISSNFMYTDVSNALKRYKKRFG